MKPYQYLLMITAIIVGHYAVNFLVSYLESRYRIVRIEDTKKKEPYVKWEDNVIFMGDVPLRQVDTFFLEEPVQRAPITGYRQMQYVETGYHNIAIGHEAGLGKNENVGY